MTALTWNEMFTIARWPCKDPGIRKCPTSHLLCVTSCRSIYVSWWPMAWLPGDILWLQGPPLLNKAPCPCLRKLTISSIYSYLTVGSMRLAGTQTSVICYLHTKRVVQLPSLLGYNSTIYPNFPFPAKHKTPRILGLLAMMLKGIITQNTGL